MPLKVWPMWSRVMGAGKSRKWEEVRNDFETIRSTGYPAYKNASAYLHAVGNAELYITFRLARSSLIWIPLTGNTHLSQATATATAHMRACSRDAGNERTDFIYTYIQVYTVCDSAF